MEATPPSTSAPPPAPTSSLARLRLLLSGGAPSPDGKLGAFLGVFTPTTLTILGVIMYLRLGWVTGHVGIGKTLLIVALANAITLATTFSFSAVATNRRVGVGGAYYIISRSLGLEVGGAIGVPLFLSQVFSVTLYSFGLAETLGLVWPEIHVRTAAAVIVVLVTLLALRGADLALRSQIPLMLLIGVSLLMLAAGVLFRDPVVETTRVEPEILEPTFWVVFAVFFPAVTGIMAGLGLSGDLRNPETAIPRGSIAAVLTGLVVYLTVPFFLAAGASDEVLRAEPLVWTRIAPLGPWLIFPGLLGAIFSSAVGSILGAPRTLQALSMDRLAPEFVGRTTKRAPEPVVGLLITMALALAGVLLGDLNAVAPVVTMFFLTVYGMVNVVAALETLAGNPSWRPKMPIPWWISLGGGLGCMGVMFLISPTWSIVAIAVEIALWLGFRRRELAADWGDARRGGYEALIRWSLLRLGERPVTARNWRPHVLLFTTEAHERLRLIRFATWFSQGRGVVTVCELVVGDLLDTQIDRDARRAELARFLDQQGIVAFAEVDVVRDVVSGIVDVAQANGIAGMDSNTVLTGWPKRPERLAEILKGLQRLDRIEKCMVIGSVIPPEPRPPSYMPEIHVWWRGLRSNGDLMLLLAYLLSLNHGWRRARIRLLSLAPDEAARAEQKNALASLLADIRIEAETTVRLIPEGRTVRSVIHEESRDADVVFLGLRVPDPGTELAYASELRAMAEGLPTFFFVKNSTRFGGELL